MPKPLILEKVSNAITAKRSVKSGHLFMRFLTTSIFIFLVVLISSCIKVNPLGDGKVTLEDDSYFTISVDNEPEIKFENKVKNKVLIEQADIININSVMPQLAPSFRFRVGPTDPAGLSNYTQVIMSINSPLGKTLKGIYTSADSLYIISPQMIVNKNTSSNVILDQYTTFALGATKDFIQIDNFGINEGDIIEGSYHFHCVAKNFLLPNADTLCHTIVGKFKVRVKEIEK